MELHARIWKNVKKNFDQTYSIVGWSDGKILLEFDTIDECNTSGRASVTQYPTEYNTKDVDYKYSEPDTVAMTGILSEGGVVARSSIIPRLGTFDKKSQIEKTRDRLRQLKRDMTLVNIQTRNAGLRTSLTLTGYEINETYDTYGTMSVSMTFQEVPQFNKQGEFVDNPADKSTQNGGIVQTRQIG